MDKIQSKEVSWSVYKAKRKQEVRDLGESKQLNYFSCRYSMNINGETDETEQQKDKRGQESMIDVLLSIIVWLMSVQVMNDETAAVGVIKRKLELCKSYSETGYCAYGENCFFAHGVEELERYQPILRKKMCRNYHQHKYCKFGSRCNFVHDPHHGFQPKKPKSMLKMMEEYPQFLTSLHFRKNLLLLL